MNKSIRSAKQTKKENYCKICDKIVIGNSYKLKSHLFKHKAIEERFSCNFCPKTFFRKDAFSTHLNRHTRETPQRKYICDYCDRAFIIKNNLIVHLKRIHDDNLDSELGKYMCSICNLMYCEKRLLDLHIRREHFNMQHFKEPLYTKKSINETWIENVNNKNTTVCITKVNNNVIVIKHFKIGVKVKHEEINEIDFKTEYSDQYSEVICDYCKKKMLKKSLRNHIKEVHMNIRKFQCKMCKRTFCRNYQLVNHKCDQLVMCKRNSIKNVFKN